MDVKSFMLWPQQNNYLVFLKNHFGGIMQDLLLRSSKETIFLKYYL